MASPVSYTQAAKVAVFAVAVDLYYNQGRTVSAIALGVLGNCALQFCKKLHTSFSYFHEFGNRLAHRWERDNPVKEQEALKKALERLQKDYPEEFERYAKYKKLSSQEEILIFFTEKLSEGCCAGTADALFDKIVRKQSRSLNESQALLQCEDVFYHQILSSIFINAKVEKSLSNIKAYNIVRDRRIVDDLEKSWLEFEQSRKAFKLKFDQSVIALKLELEKPVSAFKVDLLENDFTDKAEKIKTEIDKEGAAKEGRTKTEIEKYWAEEEERIKKQIEADYDSRLKNMSRNLHYGTFLDSEEFSFKAPCALYQEVLERAMLQFPESQDFVGLINLPKHFMSFQCGPQGYYIYDGYNNNKGLFSYPNREKFFQELRHHALYDLQHEKYSIVENKKQGAEPEEIRKDADELVKKYKSHFLIRPLDDINPSFNQIEHSTMTDS